MKIYEYSWHRSIDIDPKDINIKQTKRAHEWRCGYSHPDDYECVGGKFGWRGYEVWLHEGSKYAWPHALEGVLHVNEKTWKKIVNVPRKKW